MQTYSNESVNTAVYDGGKKTNTKAFSQLIDLIVVSQLYTNIPINFKHLIFNQLYTVHMCNQQPIDVRNHSYIIYGIKSLRSNTKGLPRAMGAQRTNIFLENYYN